MTDIIEADSSYNFGDTYSTAVRVPHDSTFEAPKKVQARTTWNHTTGYSFTEFYKGSHQSIRAAFDDPRFVCGATQVIADRDESSEVATMAVTYDNRTKQLARRSFSQAEEFKSIWTLDTASETIEIWRNSGYAKILNDDTYVSNVAYPMTRQIYMATLQYIEAWRARMAQEINEDIINVPINQEAVDTGYLKLSQVFDIWRYVEQPTNASNGYSVEDKLAAGRKLALNILYGRSTYSLFRKVITNTAVVASNASIGLSPAIFPENYLYTNANLIQIINYDIFGLRAARSRTPALCRDVNANKRALIRGLAGDKSGRLWHLIPAHSQELTNGSLEWQRHFTERFPWEIDTTVTPLFDSI